MNSTTAMIKPFALPGKVITDRLTVSGKNRPSSVHRRSGSRRGACLGVPGARKEAWVFLGHSGQQWLRRRREDPGRLTAMAAWDSDAWRASFGQSR
jgi:hypothetical protein